MTRRRMPALADAAREAVGELARLQAEVRALRGEAEAVLRRMEAIDLASAEATTRALRWLRDRELELARQGADAATWDREMAAADEAVAGWWRSAMAAHGFSGEGEPPAALH